MPEQPIFCVDMGTTRTRAWLTVGADIEAHGAADFGIRNVATGESKQWLEQQLCTLLDETYAARRTASLACPNRIAAAGMITSAQGIAEVPHVEAPAGAPELAASIHHHQLSTRADWSLLLVPGVRTGPLAAGREATLDTDIMRGEETLCIGLLQTGALQPNAALLNLGSHWKWIAIDAEKRIASSRTSLTGEMIHAVQSNTLLAASLPQHRPEAFDPDWVDLGFREAQRSGLGRALFCIRLLDQKNQATPAQRLSFLYGAFLHDEIEHLPPRKQPILISGPPGLARLWQHYLPGISVDLLEESARESAYLHGLRSLAGLSV